MTDHSSSSSEKTGYGHPPKAKRFRKGRSGNPRGRPPGDENVLAVFKRLVQQKVRVRDRNTVRTMTRLEAIIAANIAAALQKNPSAMENIMKFAEIRGELNDLKDPAVVGKPLFLPRRCTTSEEFERIYGRMGPGGVLADDEPEDKKSG